MNLWSSIIALFGPAAIAADAAPRQPAAPRERFDPRLDAMEMRAATRAAPAVNPFAFDEQSIPPGARQTVKMAMDQFGGGFTNIGEWAGSALSGLIFDREGFVGYPELAMMALRPEYRAPVEIIAEDATSQWIEFQSAGEDENKTDKIKTIEDEFTRLKVRDVMKHGCELDGFYGRGHIDIDLGTNEDPEELRKSIVDEDGNVAPAKIGKNGLRALRTVEPVWVWPQTYNSMDPFNKDWYRPTQWYCMSKEIHASRLITMISSPVPDLFKPAFMFGGLSTTQKIRPVVQNWLRTRKGVGDIINNFSMSILLTNLVERMNMSGTAGAANLINRIELFVNQRDNQGLFVLDKLAEDFKNVATPLGGLADLQAQSQEHMCSLARIPVIRLLGIQPAGLNASSEGEIAVYKKSIRSYQEYFLRPPLTHIANIVQCSKFGRVDPDIVFTFKPLEEMTALEKADLEQKRASTATIHISNGSIGAREERQRIASDPDTPYDSLDVDKKVEMSEAEGATVAQAATSAVAQAFQEGIIDRPTALRELRKVGERTGIFAEIGDELIREAEEEPPAPDPSMMGPNGQGGGEGGPEGPQGGGEGGSAESGGPKAPSFSTDAQWEEGKHKRGQPTNKGQFGPGGGGGAAHIGHRTAKPSGPLLGSPETRMKAREEAEREEGETLTKPRHWNEFTSEDDPAFKSYRDKIEEIVTKLGFDRAKVNIQFEARQFTLGDKIYYNAGHAVIDDKTPSSFGAKGTITIYPNQTSLASIAGTTAHEIEHIRFQEFIDKRNTEREQVMKIDIEDVEIGRGDKVMRADGTLKPPYDTQFPHYEAWVQAWEKVPLDVFSRSDGVSEYSKSYWDLWHEGKMDTMTAVHETFAEMMRIKLLTGKFPEHLYSGKMPKAHKSKEYPEGFSTTRGVKSVISEGAKAWRKAFKAINGEN